MNLFSYLQLASVVRSVKAGERSEPIEELIKKIIPCLNSVEKSLGHEKLEKRSLEEMSPEEMDRRCAEVCTWYTREMRLDDVQRRLDEVKRGLEKVGYQTICIDAKLEERGVFGASQRFGKFLFEVGLEFDPYLNLPIIPGSSIKGAARSTYEILKSNKNTWPPPEEIFGSGGEKAEVGKAVFLDAYPIEHGKAGTILFPDVMTPHYKKMSGEDMFKEFGWEPRPITYLSVAPATTFRFIVGVMKEYEEILRETLFETFELGIGAKTSVGYGRFRVRENVCRR